jgi:hypothetical protein
MKKAIKGANIRQKINSKEWIAKGKQRLNCEKGSFSFTVRNELAKQKN